MIKIVFLDIDNTIFSFSEFAKKTMHDGFKKYGLKPYTDEMFSIFEEINNELWRRIEQNRLTLPQLRKDTSLASSITLIEMFSVAQQVAARYYEPFALYCEAAVIYLLICTLLTWLQATVEKKLTWVKPVETEEENAQNITD